MKSIQLILLSAVIGCGITACGKGAPPQLEPASESSTEPEAANEEKIARITAQAAVDAGIEVSTARAALLRESIPLYGVIASNAERSRNVSARFAGVVRSVAVTAGARVKAGDTLATIESNDSLQVYPVTAPIAGLVTSRNVNTGEAVGEQTLFTITDLSTVWVELSAFPREMSQLHVGQKALVKSADGALSGSGRVVFLSALGTATTQSTTARVLLDNADGRWTAGLYVSADVVVQEVEVPIAVSSTAMQSLDGERVVFVAVDGGFAPRTVRSGRADGEITEIVAGLAAGERYVHANSFVVKSELAKASAGHDH
jgi:membrane fusion protein, heavy metal efflux system